MSPSIEDNPTHSPTSTAEQSPRDQVQLNHHAPPNPSSPTPEVRVKRVPVRRGSIDKDAQDLVISSLRAQVQDLVSQVTELNNKLVKSYDRVSDLEDNLHVTSSTLRTSTVKISQLELERSQHLSALNTGLLVEKLHVTSELTRLMEKATEEAARRGQAESARADIEKDLDDVSAALFDQANTMVAEARLGRAQSDRKAEVAERALIEAEDAVRLMQQELQAFQGEKEAAERSMERMRAAMGKGKWIERRSSSPVNTHRLLTSHVSYQEFIYLISHLRALRATYPQPPSISTLLGLPFVARLQLEDTDPTVRLDMAAALNWLSRRTIIAAIQSGQLTIEPIATQTILASATSPQPPLAVNVLHGSSNVNLLSCGLCGHGIMPHTEPSPIRTGYLSRANGTQFNSWSSSIFRKSSATRSYSEPPSPPPYHDTSSLPAQLYIFRLSEPSPAFPSAVPLCPSGWCLARLRATCSLWAFLRTSIVEKIWEEEEQSPQLPPPHRQIEGANVDRPPIPPRRKTKSTGFWGVASSFGLDRVPGWGEGDKDKQAEPGPEKRRFVAPQLRPSSAGPSSLTPPPLPSRNRSRVRKPVPTDSGVEGRRSSAESSARESRSSASDHQELFVSVKPEASPTLSSLLVSSSEDVDPSNGGFLTPSEDPPPEEMPFTSAESPVSLPLPESPHDTPVGTSAPLLDDANKVPTEPEVPQLGPEPTGSVPAPKEVSNPERVEATHPPPAVSAERPVSPPLRTSSPAAPPLPRRAPARRAVPPLPPAIPPAPSVPAPIADVSSAKVVEQPNNHHVEPKARAEPDDKANIPSPAVAPASDPPLPSEASGSPPKEEEVTVVSPAAETTGSAVPETSKAEAENIDVAGEAAELDGDQSDEKQEQPPSSVSPDNSIPHGNAAVENSAEDAGAVANDSDAERERLSSSVRRMAVAKEKAAAAGPARPSLPPRHPRPAVRSTALSDLTSPSSAQSAGSPSPGDKLDKPEEPGFAPDGTPYVGDGTWEERAWKELTRLREDMFWARVGSAR
ncbi:hypothetical protein BJV74DRAFT_817028 [Russula compacta]|nr:hypothetical protein BJV74DRAFT_817028 [Russula compacta]